MKTEQQQPHLDDMVGHQSPKENYSSYDEYLDGSRADPNEIKTIPDSQQDYNVLTQTNGQTKSKSSINPGQSRMTPYKIPKKTNNIMETLGLTSRKTPNNLPTAEADRIALENLKKATHWEARHQGALNAIENSPEGIPKGLTPKISCNVPEKDKSDIAEAFEAILYKCGEELANAAALHSQNRLEFFKQEITSLTIQLATTIG
ncbi:unnamed protein product [Owenia fusiformis]|uniref:Uncharacterized protein n=1 Tax=Owenia fusiformis TaxID=6347 RepID=A0A8J1YC35_OWEFU|nr:unnamed protein product [Owenia fusiformis]